MKILFVSIFLVITEIFYAQVFEPSENEALVHVKITDMNDRVRKNDIIRFHGQKSNQNFEGISNSEGIFDILLPEGDIYNIKIMGLGESKDYNTIEIGSEKGFYEGNIIISYEPAKTFTLENVHFDVNKSSLRPVSLKSLDELVKALKIKEDLVVEIAGHTDSDGEENANIILSQSRAESVVNYLTKRGIDSKRLIAKGYGESEPVADNNSSEGKQRNRRTEVRILDALP